MFSTFLKRSVARQVELAFQLPRMMAARTTSFQKRDDLLVITHWNFSTQTHPLTQEAAKRDPYPNN